MISRYVKQFTRTDPKEAMQYVYAISLSESADDGAGNLQLDLAWELTRRVIVTSEVSSEWEELVGGFRADGTRFVSGVYCYQARIRFDTTL
jgi:nuclear pore complex protein Nup93